MREPDESRLPTGRSGSRGAQLPRLERGSAGSEQPLGKRADGRCFPDLHSPEHQGLLGKSLALTSPYKVCVLDKHTRECQGSATCPLSASALPAPPAARSLFTHSPRGHQGLSPEKPGSHLPQVRPLLWPSPACLSPSWSLLNVTAWSQSGPQGNQRRALSDLLHILHHPVASNPHQTQVPHGLLCLLPTLLPQGQEEGLSHGCYPKRY